MSAPVRFGSVLAKFLAASGQKYQFAGWMKTILVLRPLSVEVRLLVLRGWICRRLPPPGEQ